VSKDFFFFLNKTQTTTNFDQANRRNEMKKKKINKTIVGKSTQLIGLLLGLGLGRLARVVVAALATALVVTLTLGIVVVGARRLAAPRVPRPVAGAIKQ
jgi:predicted lipid-binding transport protein (Tim44 family)